MTGTCERCGEPMLTLGLDPKSGNELVCALCAEEMYESPNPPLEDVLDTILFNKVYREELHG
jgi:hypothetical protein